MLRERAAQCGRQRARTLRLALQQMAEEAGGTADRLAGIVEDEVEAGQPFSEPAREQLDARRMAQVEAMDLLHEVAEALCYRMTLSPGDLKEDLIHSLQKHVEVDEPEAEAGELVDQAASADADREEDTVTFDRMTEEDLLAGIEGLVPPEKSDDY